MKKVADNMQRGHQGALLKAAQAGRVQMVHAPGVAARVGGKSIDVKVKHLDQNTVSVKWGPAGWVRILNDRTQPHFIARRGRGLGGLRNQNLEGGTGAKRRSRRAGKLLLGTLAGTGVGGQVKGAIGIPGVGPRAYAKHPGTKGKHFVEKGKQSARPIVMKTYADAALTEPLKQAFRG